MTLVVLLGHPVAHSLSPVMHNAAFKSLGLPHTYETLDVTTDALSGVVERIRAGGLLGANVTVPYKAAVARLLDRLANDASRLGVVNTLVMDAGGVVGHNTDARGFEAANLERGLIAMDRVLVLGAGGAARAVVLALLRGGNSVFVAARDRAKSDALVGSIAAEDGSVAVAVDWVGIDTLEYDAVVNATPLGLHGEDPLGDHPLPPLVADIVPLASTPLLRRAEAQGCEVMDGLGMLLQQAVLSFRIWTGQDAPVEVMRAALYARAS
jgi:shikimate dehydrogenase